MTEFFIPPETCNGFQLLFLTAVYGFCLFKGSGMISDGSELLLLVPSIAGMVGSIVLPVVGTVPDTLMVLFSGLGPNAEETVSVGVGAIAGATIMIITIPWFLSIIGGRVSIDYATGDCVYERSRQEIVLPSIFKSNWGYFGVSNSPLVRANAVFMLASAPLFLVIQIPTWVFGSSVTRSAGLFGSALCTGVFILYLYRQYKASKELNSVVEDRVAEARANAIKTGEMTLLGAMKALVNRFHEKQNATSSKLVDSLLDDSENRLRNEMRLTLEPFVRQYESRSEEAKIRLEQFRIILHDLGMLKSLSEEEVVKIFHSADLDHSGHIDLDEMSHLMLVVIKQFDDDGMRDGGSVSEEMPDDLTDLNPQEQQKRVIYRSIRLMAFGTFLILVFSEPAIGVMTEIAYRIQVNPFYISFVLAALSSCAGEIMATYSYARRRTKKSIQVAFTTLEGAVCLSNTLCLAVFLAIVGFRGLPWTFAPEVITILLVEFGVGAFALFKKRVFTMTDAFLILALYPSSFALVAILKYVGLQ
jgi:Ca2+/Na+ antiporter